MILAFKLSTAPLFYPSEYSRRPAERSGNPPQSYVRPTLLGYAQCLLVGDSRRNTSTAAPWTGLCWARAGPKSSLPVRQEVFNKFVMQGVLHSERHELTRAGNSLDYNAASNGRPRRSMPRVEQPPPAFNHSRTHPILSHNPALPGLVCLFSAYLTAKIDKWGHSLKITWNSAGNAHRVAKPVAQGALVWANHVNKSSRLERQDQAKPGGAHLQRFCGLPGRRQSRHRPPAESCQPQDKNPPQDVLWSHARGNAAWIRRPFRPATDSIENRHLPFGGHAVPESGRLARLVGGFAHGP